MYHCSKQCRGEKKTPGWTEMNGCCWTEYCTVKHKERIFFSLELTVWVPRWSPGEGSQDLLNHSRPTSNRTCIPNTKSMPSVYILLQKTYDDIIISLDKKETQNKFQWCLNYLTFKEIFQQQLALKKVFKSLVYYNYFIIVNMHLLSLYLWNGCSVVNIATI